MNALTCNPEEAARQPRQPRYFPRREDPLRGAVIANAQLKLCLRRLRADALGSHRTAAITRLLDVAQSVDRSLSWLHAASDQSCRPLASRPELDDLGSIAMETQVSCAEAVAQ